MDQLISWSYRTAAALLFLSAAGCNPREATVTYNPGLTPEQAQQAQQMESYLQGVLQNQVVPAAQNGQPTGEQAQQ